MNNQIQKKKNCFRSLSSPYLSARESIRQLEREYKLLSVQQYKYQAIRASTSRSVAVSSSRTEVGTIAFRKVLDIARLLVTL